MATTTLGVKLDSRTHNRLKTAAHKRPIFSKYILISLQLLMGRIHTVSRSVETVLMYYARPCSKGTWSQNHSIQKY